jgi:hypothetical protein
MTAKKQRRPASPLVQIESHLIAACNILYSNIVWENPRRWPSLDTAIDEALRIVQAWKDDDETPVREREQ